MLDYQKMMTEYRKKEVAAWVGVIVVLVVIGLSVFIVCKAWPQVWAGVSSAGFVLARVLLHSAFRKTWKED